ncbi:MAG TPA: arsenite methyltransferase [Bacteroidales bacterium]|nr:MAG: Ubiquinone/menaquinone biosynthesis C-methyltransferase UbiE [Deltaproteobacteria bacterium ADurb.Bin072]HOH81219.1 arsenite methyltransferase [Methanoregulaceae archaeon]HPA69695.1 arsenite methyltransferase [Bacteroidales bacterium]HPO41034.1 arsenite methyltransferase [Bacteroidales bacterium]HQM56846.1 arsenite methyltransferase [Methanoregulaceae archaeon]
MTKRKHEEIRNAVRENYGKVAQEGTTGCCCSTSSCCGKPGEVSLTDISLGLGYSSKDVADIPDGSNMGLGCGNPQAIASLQPGETVLDLGSGGGFDCFLAARSVGDKGHVIGVDMTPEMITRSRENAEKGGFLNVEFRLGELENLPVADGIVDVIISNCVINLSPEKERVFQEAFRVLKPGGRLAISDIVSTAELPDDIRSDLALHVGCIAGASSIQELESMLHRTGFKNIQINPKAESRMFIRDWIPGSKVEEYVLSATIEAVKTRS